MSWLSELKWSNTDERIMQMVAGDEELDESVVSTYDRKQGFLFKIAEKVKSCTNGYTVEETKVTFFNDDVTTEDSGGVAGAVLPVEVTAPTITVTFDDEEYTVAAQDLMGMLIYGELVDENPVFDTYPFFIYTAGGTTMIMTAEAGTYALKIEVPGYEATTTPEFDAAVKAVGGGAVFATFTKSDDTWSCNKTFAELQSAYDNGFPVFAGYRTNIGDNVYGWHQMQSGVGTLFINPSRVDGFYGDQSKLIMEKAYISISEDSLSCSVYQYQVTATAVS